MPDIVLATLNARYSHSALGLRYLYANMGDLRGRCQIVEFTIAEHALDIAEKLLALKPSIIGLGCYIWNAPAMEQLLAVLKQLSPATRLIVGGPEVSYPADLPPWTAHADHVITGAADRRFAEVCRSLLQGESVAEKIVASPLVPLSEIELPYDFYTEEDIAHRVLYVEASRGCPFKCEFCLSALDKTAWPFNIERVLAALDRLHRRGARQFKFVDRTFNLKAATAERILRFFLDRADESLFLHFELIPDHLPESLKPLIAQFAPGMLQFEIGIQTFDPKVQALISRRQDDTRACGNIRWLREHTQVHLHTDLIAGLPGEDLAGFAAGFNRLIELDPHEIQVGILKRLRGAPIDRHSQAHAMRYNPYPPYNVLSTDRMDFATLQRLQRFARFWDMIGNSGRFQQTRPLILAPDPFARFWRLSDWLFRAAGQTHQIALPRLFDLLYDGMVQCLGADAQQSTAALAEDFSRSGLRSVPSRLHAHVAGLRTKQSGWSRKNAARQARWQNVSDAKTE